MFTTSKKNLNQKKKGGYNLPFFLTKKNMIPNYLEELIHKGEAEFKSYSGFAAENHIIKVPDSCYVIIYEYWYKPQCEWDFTLDRNLPEDYPSPNYKDLATYVHFYTGNKYHPFFHKTTLNPIRFAVKGVEDPTQSGVDFGVTSAGVLTDYRQCYIGSSKDVSIYFTRLIDTNVTYTPVTAPPINQYIENLGYATLPVSGKINRFNVGTVTHYGPLQQPYSALGGFTSIDFNQAFTTPLNGRIESPETVLGTNAEKSQRQLFFHCNYIQVNKPAPKTLI